jgi:hypothetical protein
MRGHHDEPHVAQEVGIDHAVLDRTVPQRLQRRPDIRADVLRVEQLADVLRATERLQRPNTPADQFIDHPRQEAIREIIGGRSGLHPHRGQQYGVGRHRRGRKPVRPGHRPGRSVERVTQASWLALTDVGGGRRRHLTARPPLQHDHRQPRFLLEFRVGQVVFVAEGCGVYFPEGAAARVLGKLFEGFEPQRCDSSRH